MNLTYFHSATKTVRLSDEGRAQAAVALKVPMSGVPELDAMIREAALMDIAKSVLGGFASDGEANYGPSGPEGCALDWARDMLAKRGGCWVAPEVNPEGGAA